MIIRKVLRKQIQVIPFLDSRRDKLSKRQTDVLLAKWADELRRCNLESFVISLSVLARYFVACKGRGGFCK